VGEAVIKINLKEIVCENVEWIHLSQDRDQWRALLNAVMNFLGSVKVREFLD
jgi:hypothetical protein